MGSIQTFSVIFFLVGESGKTVALEDLPMEEFFMREENFKEGAPGFPSIIQKTITN